MTGWRLQLTIALLVLAPFVACQAGEPSVPGPEGGSAPIQIGSASVYLGISSSGVGGAGAVGGAGGDGGDGGAGGN
jgi:hypothetical protein